MMHPYDLVQLTLNELGPYRMVPQLTPEKHGGLLAMLKRAPAGLLKKSADVPWVSSTRSVDFTLDKAEAMSKLGARKFVEWVKEVRDRVCEEIYEEISARAAEKPDCRLVCAADEWFDFLATTNGGMLTVFFGCLYYFEPILAPAARAAPERVDAPEVVAGPHE